MFSMILPKMRNAFHCFPQGMHIIAFLQRMLSIVSYIGMICTAYPKESFLFFPQETFPIVSHRECCPKFPTQKLFALVPTTNTVQYFRQGIVIIVSQNQVLNLQTCRIQLSEKASENAWNVYLYDTRNSFVFFYFRHILLLFLWFQNTDMSQLLKNKIYQNITLFQAFCSDF